MIGMLILSGGLYSLYLLGVFVEQRHRERCFLCAREIDLSPRDWKRDGSYWDSSQNRWAHLDCKLDQVQAIRKAGGM